MSEHKVRIFHISDLHERAKRGDDSWRRRRVLGDAWKKNLDEVLKGGEIDLVCFTGDVADWGLPAEYEAVTGFVEEMLARLGVPKERFFVVPGNHDVQRKTNESAWRALREDLFQRVPGDAIDRLALSRWMADLCDAPRGVDEAVREQVLERSAPYRQWVEKMLGRGELLPERSAHKRLGYRHTLLLARRPFDIHVIGLETAWLSGKMSKDDTDAGKLLLTSDQIGKLTNGDDGGALPGLRLALMHHPLSDLADGDEVRGLLASNVDLILRGHLHRESLEEWVDPAQRLRLIAVGSLYEGDLGDTWPNACHVVEIDVSEAGRPLRYTVRFRGWSANGTGFWCNDNTRYPGTVDGVLAWRTADAPPLSVRSPVPNVFIGRTKELAALAHALLPASGAAKPVAIVAVQGMPGVGKSYLADRFAAEHAASFPGGMVRLVLRRDDDRSSGDLLGELADKLGMTADAGRIRARLLEPRTLLHIENADTETAARAAAGLVAVLRGGAVLVTARFHGLGTSAGWAQIELKPFDAADAVKQIEAEHRPAHDGAERDAFRRLARELGYLPLALSLAAGHLRDGRSVDGFLELLRRKRLALPPADAADVRATLAATFELSLELFEGHLGADAARLLPGFEALGDAPLAGFGASLGGAISGLTRGEFEELVVAARKLSLVLDVEKGERSDDAVRVHPLLAEILRLRPGAGGAFERMTGWFVARLPAAKVGEEESGGARWKEIHAEGPGLGEWLGRVGADAIRTVVRAGTRYAMRCGPFHAWMAFCERGLSHRTDPEERSDLLWTLANVAQSAGALDRAMAAAEEKATIEHGRGAEREVALAAGLRADILAARGELDEALRIRREEELPVFERLGDVRERAVTLGKVADILTARGALDEALRIRREEELPVFERLGDVRSRAVTLGQVADILTKRGELDEALRIRREEELPVYERLGDVYSRAVTLGKVADILASRGELDEALRILREVQLPVFERLGDVRSRALTLGNVADILASRGELDEALRIHRDEVLSVFERLGDIRMLLVARANMALIHLERAHPGDRDAAAELLRLALRDAERLRIPEAQQIRAIQAKHGLDLATT